MEYSYKLVDMKKFYGNSNDGENTSYTSAVDQYSDCTKLVSQNDSECDIYTSNIQSSGNSSLKESVQQVSSKPSISNQRILEDLSHSQSSYLTFQQQLNSVKPDQDKISSRSRMMFGEQHYTGTFGEIDDQQQLVHQNLNGMTSSEGSGTSIHISFNDNYMTETNIVHNQPKQWEFNNVPHSSNVNGASKSSCRSLRVHLNSDLAVVERNKLEKKRERNRLAASKCRQRKMEKIQTLEEQVDELQSKIRNMQEQIMRLSCENADLRNDLKHNEEQHSQVEYTTESFNSKNLAGETTSKNFSNPHNLTSIFNNNGLDRNINTETGILSLNDFGRNISPKTQAINQNNEVGLEDMNNGKLIVPEGPDSTSKEEESNVRESKE